MQASLELDITSVEYAEDEFTMAGDLVSISCLLYTGRVRKNV